MSEIFRAHFAIVNVGGNHTTRSFVHGTSIQAASTRPGTSPAAGTILLISSLLEILAMAHHPSVRTPDIAQAVQDIARFSKLSAVVHAALIAFMLLIAYGLSDFALRRGLERPLIRTGAIAYGIGVIAMLSAALVSGFVIADFTFAAPHVTILDLQINGQVLLLCRALNQAYANCGVIAMSAGILCWSLDLSCDPGVRRFVGWFGCLVGVVPALALMFGVAHLDVVGMGTVVALQGAWNVAIAILVIRAAM